MSTTNNGGPAFPFLELDGAGALYQQNPGMTLRDYFAAKALQGLLKPAEPYEELHWNVLANDAYKMADAMLKAREAK